MKIDHIAIWVNNLELMKEFYVKYFKGKCNQKYFNPQKNLTTYFLNFSDGTRMEIMNNPGINKKQAFGCIGLTHMAINVGTIENVDSLTAHLKTDGYKVDSKPRFTGDGYYESIVRDPENNIVELVADKQIKVEDAVVDDLDEILYLQKCCYLSEAELVINYNILPITQTFDEIVADFQNQKILKIEYQNRIIGSVRAFKKGDTCFIGRLIVDRHFQNMGYGKMLMQAIEQKYNSVSRYELFTGKNSIKNMALYKKLGYNIINYEKLGNIDLVYLEKLNN